MDLRRLEDLFDLHENLARRSCIMPLWLHSAIGILSGFLLYLAFDVLLAELRWRTGGTLTPVRGRLDERPPEAYLRALNRVQESELLSHLRMENEALRERVKDLQEQLNAYIKEPA